jgi:hypothetical protein
MLPWISTHARYSSPACCGEPEDAATPLQQPGAHLGLEPLQGQADGGLAQQQPVRCRGYAALVHDDDEGAQQIPVEVADEPVANVGRHMFS